MKKMLIVTSGLLLLLAGSALTAFAGDMQDGLSGMGAAGVGEMKAAAGAAAQEKAEDAGTAEGGAAAGEAGAAAEGGAAADEAGAAADEAGEAAGGAAAAGEATPAAESPLVNQLTSQLGVTQPQALGGAGAIFGAAKQNLQPSEFGQISSAVPNMGSYLEAAPKAQGVGGMLGGLSGTAGKVGTMATLASSFSQLGLSADMVGKFTPIVLDYVQTQGGSSAMSLLQKGLQ